jgi:hypothetical protein
MTNDKALQPISYENNGVYLDEGFYTRGQLEHFILMIDTRTTNREAAFEQIRSVRLPEGIPSKRDGE